MLAIKQLLAISYKELRLWLQTPGNWLSILLVPFAFIAVMGSIFGRSTPVFTIYAVNEDEGDRGAEVIKMLGDSPNLELEVLPSRAEADRRVGSGERMAAAIIPAGFTQAVTTDAGGAITVIVDPARKKDAGLVKGLMQAALSKLMVDAAVERGMSGMIDDMQGGVGGVNQGDMQLFIRAGVKAVVSNQVEDALDHPLIPVDSTAVSDVPNPVKPNLLAGYVPGYTLMFVFFLLSQLASTVVEERSLGSLRRLLTTPVDKAVILLGKMLPFFLIAAAQMAFVLLVSSVVFSMPLGNSPVALAAVILATAITVATMGIMIAALMKTENQAGVVTILIVLVLAVISGCMSDSIMLPGISMATPHYWAREGMTSVLQRGAGLNEVLMPVGILLGMSVLFFVIGARRFRYE